MGYSAWAEQTVRLHSLSSVVEVVKLSCWAPGVEALLAIHLELI